MPSGVEAALVKPLVDALVALYRKAKGTHLKSTAEAALAEAIRELLLAPSDLRSAEAKIAVAKAAGIINDDLVLAEDMVGKHKRAPKKGPTRPARVRKEPVVAKKATKAVAKAPTASKTTRTKKS